MLPLEQALLAVHSMKQVLPWQELQAGGHGPLGVVTAPHEVVPLSRPPVEVASTSDAEPPDGPESRMGFAPPLPPMLAST
jgi:hypothetical protein